MSVESPCPVFGGRLQNLLPLQRLHLHRISPYCPLGGATEQFKRSPPGLKDILVPENLVQQLAQWQKSSVLISFLNFFFSQFLLQLPVLPPLVHPLFRPPHPPSTPSTYLFLLSCSILLTSHISLSPHHTRPPTPALSPGTRISLQVLPGTQRGAVKAAASPRTAASLLAERGATEGQQH